MASKLPVVLGMALTGERLGLTSMETLVGDLGRLGYDSARLGKIRAQRQRQQLPWPFPVSSDVLRDIGFARFDAALQEARHALGVTGLYPTQSAARPPDRDEQRLMADRPPHW